MQPLKTSRGLVVTGAAGFIGSYLVKSLLARGVPGTEIWAVDELNFFDQRRCCQAFKAQGVHLIDTGDFVRQLADGRVPAQMVFHMGACSSTEELREDYLNEVNLKYSRDLWNICVKLKIPYLYASSAATYGDGTEGFSDDPAKIPALRPLNPYGWSKQYFDLFVLDEVGRGKAPPFWAGFKFFNVYGPGEDHKGRQASVAFHARRQFLDKGFVKLFRSHKEGVADGAQSRDFVWVGDVVDTLLSFAGGTHRSGIYNVGSGRARSFLDLIRAVAQALNVEAKIEFIDTPQALRERYQYWTEAELTNLRAAGYAAPFTSIEDGVREYFEEEPL